MSTKDEPTADRREVVSALAAGGALGLAGCPGDDDSSDSSGDLGERVPTVSLGIFSGAGGLSAKQEDLASIIENNFEERLGVDTEIVAKEISAWVSDVDGDARTFTFPITGWATTPASLDPEEHTRAYAIDNMGYPNVPRYANCEYSEPAIAQSTSPSIEEREELVNEAHSILSEDAGVIPITSVVTLGAYRSDLVDVGGLGETGLQSWSHYVYLNSDPAEEGELNVNSAPELIEDTNYVLMTNPTLMPIWTNLIHSPLVEYDDDFQFNNVLAENIEVSDDATSIDVELREHTFSNGDPVTAEDVKYTFELLWTNSDDIPRVSEVPLDSIEVVNDRQVQFNFTDSFLPAYAVHFPNWGILHKDTWESQNAMENVTDFEFPDRGIVGSGPMEVATLESGQLLQLIPRDSHPVHGATNTVNFIMYREVQSAYQSLETGEVEIVFDLSTGLVDQANNADNIEVLPGGGTMPWVANPYYPIAPTKFKSFRQAAAAAIDRQEITDVIAFGETEPALTNCLFMESHPWRPPEDMLTQQTDEPTGDREQARSYLEEAGFGWDDNGNLRYPADADTDPLWPEGEIPSADDFPCIEEYY